MILSKNANNPVFALSCLLEGLGLLKHPALRKFLIIPLVINLVLYTVVLFLSYYFISGLIQSMIPDWLHWLNWLLWPLFFISFMVISFFTFTLVANLIAAPYYSQLASKTLEVITGQVSQQQEIPWNKVFLGELKRIVYILKRVLPLLLLFLIPVVNFVAPLLWAVFSAWGIAMEYTAYPLEHRGLAFEAQKQFLQQSRWGVLSFGAVTSIGLSLPIVNLLFASGAVIGATIYVHRVGQG